MSQHEEVFYTNKDSMGETENYAKKMPENQTYFGFGLWKVLEIR